MKVLRSDSFSPYLITNLLKYGDEQISKTNVGNQYIYWRIRMGDVFDPNPLILTGGISGFAQYAALYGRYLVLAMEVTITLVNNETFPVVVVIAPTLLDQATIITTGAAALNLEEYPQSKKRLLSERGGMNRCSFTELYYLPQFTGQPGAYLNSLTYSAPVTVSPATQTFFNVAISSATNFTALGVTQTAQYRYVVRWTERLTPNA